MAATLLTVAAKTYDAGLTDLTDMTGGNSEDVGILGSDWTWLSNTSAFNGINGPEEDEAAGIRKGSGLRQIIPVRYSSGADPLPTMSNSINDTHVFTADAGDRFNVATALPGTSGDDGVICSVTGSRLGSGISYTFPVSMDLKTFWWMGWQTNGGFRAEISISDASHATQYYDLPFGALNVETQAWFEATFQGTWDQVDDGVTVTIKIDRYYVESGRTTATICLRGQLLRPDVPYPQPRGLFIGRRH